MVIDNTKNYSMALVVIISIFLVLIAGALLVKHISNINHSNTIAIIETEGSLSVDYIDGKEISFNDKKNHQYNVTITNLGTEKLYYSLYLNDIVTDKKVKIEVIDEDKKTVYIDEDATSNNELISILSLESGETVRYTINLKAEKKADFKATIKVVNESLVTQTFADIIVLNNDITIPKTTAASQIATTNEGLISTNDDDGISYYFRGESEKNYVQIGNYLFRIIRINGDGTVRVILEDKISDEYEYNTNTLENISDNVIFDNTTLATNLNKWLENNLGNYLNSIVDGKFCVDTEFNNHISGVTYTDGYRRTFYEDPSLTCKGTTYTGKIGLINIDELLFAGATRGEDNKKYYLYNENVGDYLIMTPYYLNSSNEIFIMSVNENGKLSEGTKINKKIAIRPVINLSVDAKVKGKGTIDEPYVLVS